MKSMGWRKFQGQRLKAFRLTRSPRKAVQINSILVKIHSPLIFRLVRAVDTTAAVKGWTQGLVQWQDLMPAVPTTSSGFAALDEVLPGGGWPNAGVCEILMPPGLTCNMGTWALLRQALPVWCGSVARQTRHAVVIGAPHAQAEPWLPGLPAAFAHLHWLWVKTMQLRSAYWAAEQALRCHDTGVLLLWASALSRQNSSRLDENTVLRRLQVLAAGAGKPVVVFRPEAAALMASPAPVRVHVRMKTQALQLSIQVIKRPGLPASGWVSVDARNPRMQALMQALSHSRDLARKPRVETAHETWPPLDRLLAA
jgi:protein ImuA